MDSAPAGALGFLIVPLAAFFACQRRTRLIATPLRPRWTGLAIVGASIVILLTWS